MNIEKYIECFKQSYWTHTDDGFASILKERSSFGINTKIIVSTSVFPEIIKLKNEYYLIWDMKYWDFYDKYIRYVAFFLRDKASEDAIKLCQTNIYKIIFEFLVCKTSKYPLISYCIARDILHGNPFYNRIEDGAICCKFANRSITGNLMQARLYVLLHENYHYEYKTNKALFNEDIQTINQILNHILEKKIFLTLTNVSDQEQKLFYDTVKSLLEHEKPTLMEEIVCNYRAFIQLYDIYRNLGYQDDQYVLQDLIETIRISLQFQSSLVLVNNCWDISINAFEQIFNGKSMEQVGTKHADELLQIKKQSVIQNEIIYQILLFHSIVKYKKLSLFEMESKEKINKYLLPVIESTVSWDSVINIFMSAKNLFSNTTFNPLQIIEARNMLMTWI